MQVVVEINWCFWEMECLVLQRNELLSYGIYEINLIVYYQEVCVY